MSEDELNNTPPPPPGMATPPPLGGDIAPPPPPPSINTNPISGASPSLLILPTLTTTLSNYFVS